MADVKNVITLGIGCSPGDIRYFVLVGLDIFLDLPTDVTLSDAVVTTLALSDAVVTSLAASDASVTTLTVSDAGVTTLAVSDASVTTLTLTHTTGA